MGMVPSDHFILTGSFKPDCLHTNVIAAATESTSTSSQCPHSGDNLPHCHTDRRWTKSGEKGCLHYIFHKKFPSEGDCFTHWPQGATIDLQILSPWPGRPVKSIIIVKVITYNLQSNNTIYTISTPYLHYLHHLSDPRAARARTTAAPTPTINVILDIFHFLYFPLLIRSIFCPSIAISPLSCRDCKGN